MINIHRSGRPRRPLRRRTLVAAAAALLGAAPLTAVAAAPAGAVPQAGAPAFQPPPSAAELQTSMYLDSIRDRPAALRSFFRALPKGGELHNHLSGAVSTEFLIDQAGKDGLCIRTADMTAVQAPCGPGTRPAAEAASDPSFTRALIRAWSMQDLPKGESGHDHFFAAFGKFGEVSWRHPGKLLAQVANTTAEQHQFSLETMATPASSGAKKLADRAGWTPDFAAMRRRLAAGGAMDDLVAQARKEASATEAEFRTAAHCGTSHPDPGCRVPVRWISQVSRNSSPARVFTQMELGMRLSERDPRFAAVNLVQPEDGEVALRDYHLQMRMLGYLRKIHPKAHLTLHAGELVPGLVKPKDLTFHIDDAVRTAHAERIGHGVDLVHEHNWQSLARTMAARKIAVEVPFTSNAQILGVRGAAHPFETYRRYGVPVVLATDDPGISRIDISHEYQYASRTYGLGYRELKDLARASLQYAFLPGRGLWTGRPGSATVAACAADVPGRAPHAACARYLHANPKAAVEWREEAAFASFERTHAGPVV